MAEPKTKEKKGKNPEAFQEQAIELIFQALPQLKEMLDNQHQKQQLEIKKLNLECDWLEIQIAKQKPKTEA